MSDPVYNVLFLCTGNSARSIIGEAVMNNIADGRYRAFSAGSTPKGDVHPMTLETLTRAGISTAGLRSKSWDEFAAPDAPQMDFIFTVCDDAAGESCPVWPGHPMTAHWGLADPAAAAGPDFKRRAAFEDTLRYLRNRVMAFASLPLKSVDRLALHSRLQDIGAMEGTTRSDKGAA